MLKTTSSLLKVFNEIEVQAVEEVLESCAAPETTAVRLTRALNSDQAQQWAQEALFCEVEPRPLLKILCKTLSQSEFLTSILETNPDLLVSFNSESDFEFSSSLEVYHGELHKHLGHLQPGEDFEVGLKRFKLHEIFRIAVRDIAIAAPIETLARELSDLGDTVLQTAYERSYLETLNSFGAPRIEDGSLVELAILSLGKHGSRELNFSSDLDLVFIYPHEGKTNLDTRKEDAARWMELHPLSGLGAIPDLIARTRPFTFERFFNQLGTRLIEILSETGEQGFLYRVDMRLRPEGKPGPLVRTLDSALDYYRNWGERWERQALLRTRVSAGDLTLGTKFLEGIRDFVFRKYVDDIEVEETLSEMRQLRAKSIEQAGSSDEETQRNLKNGPGGIRDIEFLVQAVQTLYGGQFPEFRQGSLFEILRRIHQSGLMSAQDYATLSTGYEFLRRLEHRIQIDDLQKYHLPSSGHGLEVLAAGLRFDSGAHLAKRLSTLMVDIHSVFRVVFREEEGQGGLAELLEQEGLSLKWRETLEGYGLRDPEGLFRSLSTLAEDPASPHLNSKLRRLLKSILPRLLAAVRETPSPDLGWRTFHSVAMATPARSTLFSIAQENPQLIALLVRVGAASPYLGNLIQSQPNLVESLVSPSFQELIKDSGTLARTFVVQESARSGEGSRLPRLRSFRTRKELQIGARFVLGNADLQSSLTELSTLAEFCLEQCIGEIPNFDSGGIGLFGLGKFGGAEIGFGSDLDLVAFYDSGIQPSAEIPKRLLAKLSTEMGTRTGDGRLFEVDFRLRPHGKSGPLVTEVGATLDYYNQEGQTWERLALTRLRPLLGPHELIERVLDGIGQWVYSSPADEQVLSEIRQMRTRIETEKSSESLKAGPGGLLDIEFITQAGGLRWGAEMEEVRSTITYRALENLGKAGALTAMEVVTLRESYLFLRDIENRLILLGKPGARGLPKDRDELGHLFRCLLSAGNQAAVPEGAVLDGPGGLVEFERETRKRVRKIFNEVFERGFAAVGSQSGDWKSGLKSGNREADLNN